MVEHSQSGKSSPHYSEGAFSSRSGVDGDYDNDSDENSSSNNNNNKKNIIFFRENNEGVWILSQNEAQEVRSIESDYGIIRLCRTEGELRKQSVYNIIAQKAKARSLRHKQQRIFQKMFSLSSNELLIYDCSCAIQKTVLFHGRMYWSDKYICFYSNIFSHETKLKLKWSSIKSILKRRTALLFKNALEIVTNNNQHYIFRSYLHRDKIFNMLSFYLEWSNRPQRIRQSSLSTPVSISGSLTLEYASEASDGVDSSNDDSSQLETSDTLINSMNLTPQEEKLAELELQQKDEKLLINNQSNDSSTLSLPKTPRDESEISAPESSAPSEFHLEDRLWRKQEEMFNDAEMSVVIEEEFNLSPADFFNRFLSDNAIFGLHEFYEHRKEKDIEVDPWVFHEQLGHTRAINFVTPVPDAPPLYPKQSRISITQRYHFHSIKDKETVGARWSLEMFVEMASLDVPYGSSFRMLEKWQVVPINKSNEPDKCKLLIYSGVRFIQRVWGVKNIITSRVKKDVTNGWLLFIKLAKAALEKGVESGVTNNYSNQLIADTTNQIDTSSNLPVLPSIEEHEDEVDTVGPSSPERRFSTSILSDRDPDMKTQSKSILQIRQFNMLHILGMFILILIIYWLYGLTTSVHSLSSSVQSIVDMQRQGPLSTISSTTSNNNNNNELNRDNNRLNEDLIKIIQQLQRDVSGLKNVLAAKSICQTNNDGDVICK